MDGAIRVALCDDEIEALNQLAPMVSEALSREGYQANISCFTSAIQLLEALSRKEPFQLLLLDVMMENLDGMTLAERLRQEGCALPVIFISSNREMALKGYRVQALRYLAKPVEPALLKEAIGAACRILSEKREMLFHTAAGLVRMSPADILYLEVWERGSRVHPLSGPPFAVRVRIGALEKTLPGDQFFRCHQGFLVNLAHIGVIRRNELVIKENTVIPVSKYRLTQLKDKFMAYLSS